MVEVHGPRRWRFAANNDESLTWVYVTVGQGHRPKISVKVLASGGPAIFTRGQGIYTFKGIAKSGANNLGSVRFDAVKW